MKYSHVIREPYRLFFPLGCLSALIGVGYWVLFSLKVVPDYMPDSHSSLQMQVFVHFFILGFLTTAMPRLTGTVSAQPGEVFHMALCVVGQACLLLTKQIFAAHVLFGWTLVALVIFIAQRLKSRSSGAAGGPPPEFVWLPFAMLTAWLGMGLEWAIQIKILSMEWLLIAKKMVEQGWVLGVICGVGGFLAPRLMGTFRTPSLTNPSAQKTRKFILHATLGFLFLISFLMEGYSVMMGLGLRATVVSIALLYSLNGLAWPKATEFYARLIWFSFLSILIGLWANVFFLKYASLALHVLTIGGISLMIFAVATMVVLTHQGRPELLRKRLPILWLVAGATLVSLSLRVGAVFDASRYFMWMGIAGSIWSVAVFIWLLWMLPKVIHPVNPEIVERQHQEAKERIAALRR